MALRSSTIESCDSTRSRGRTKTGGEPMLVVREKTDSLLQFQEFVTGIRFFMYLSLCSYSGIWIDDKDDSYALLFVTSQLKICDHVFLYQYMKEESMHCSWGFADYFNIHSRI